MSKIKTLIEDGELDTPSVDDISPEQKEYEIEQAHNIYTVEKLAAQYEWIVLFFDGNDWDTAVVFCKNEPTEYEKYLAIANERLWSKEDLQTAWDEKWIEQMVCYRGVGVTLDDLYDEYGLEERPF